MIAAAFILVLNVLVSLVSYIFRMLKNLFARKILISKDT